MARSIHTQINTRICRLAVLIATACGGFSASTLAADGQKEETITVSAAAAQESAWGPAPTIAAKRSATATKTDTPIEKNAAVRVRRDARRDGYPSADHRERSVEL